MQSNVQLNSYILTNKYTSGHFNLQRAKQKVWQTPVDNHQFMKKEVNPSLIDLLSKHRPTLFSIS